MPHTMEMIEIIYKTLLPELERNGIEDTPLHRLWALEGLVDGWLEDNPPPEAMPWINAAKFEMVLLKLKSRAPIILAK